MGHEYYYDNHSYRPTPGPARGLMTPQAEIPTGTFFRQQPIILRRYLVVINSFLRLIENGALGNRLSRLILTPPPWSRHKWIRFARTLENIAHQ